MSKNGWQNKTLAYLASESSPGVLTRASLNRVADFFGCDVSYRWFSNWIKANSEHGILEQVINGVYLNKIRNPKSELVEAIPFIQSDAIVSLNYVLGEHGVINNYTNIITAVVPTDKHTKTKPKLGKIETNAGIFHLYGMNKKLCLSGTTKDRLQQKTYPCATPEKAFLDCLYLGNHHRSSLTTPNHIDVELSELNEKKLYRLAKEMGLTEKLDMWINKYNPDQDFEPISHTLGF